mmetsp:Transcript_39812/g.60144  ORF Transcript_39812/g.60144 Transcript_39812/m.60144 type:complete len:198 (-) Transcript_39812:129-722(-)
MSIAIQKHQMINLIHSHFYQHTIPRSPAQSICLEERAMPHTNGHGGVKKPHPIGPGHYKAEPASLQDHGPTKVKNPQYHFSEGERNENGTYNLNGGRMKINKVGPGSYHDEPKSLQDHGPTKVRNPQYEFTHSERRHLVDHPPANANGLTRANPTGPGQYSPQFDKVAVTNPKFGFGPAARFPRPPKLNIPGPGTYL